MNGSVEIQLHTRKAQTKAIILTTVLTMTTTDGSAKNPDLWYMSFRPIFERSYEEIRNGKTVQRTERLTSSEVEEIIDTLSRNEEFIAAMREYAAIVRKYGNEVPREKDAEIGQKFIPYIDAALKKKNLKMDYFFSNSLTIEVLQRIEAGKIGVEN